MLAHSNMDEAILLQKTRDCVDFLQLTLPSTGRHPGHARDDRWQAWLKAVYEDSGFLCSGDCFAVYQECRGKPVDSLGVDQVCACVTFLLRQMRNEYEPYPSLTDGELLALLNRWIELTEEGNG